MFIFYCFQVYGAALSLVFTLNPPKGAWGHPAPKQFTQTVPERNELEMYNALSMLLVTNPQTKPYMFALAWSMASSIVLN